MSVAAACAIAVMLVTDPANRVIVSGIPSACLVTAAALSPKAHSSVVAGARAGAAGGCVLFDLSRAGADGVAGKHDYRKPGPRHSVAVAGYCHERHRRGAWLAAQYPCGAAFARPLPTHWPAPNSSPADPGNARVRRVAARLRAPIQQMRLVRFDGTRYALFADMIASQQHLTRSAAWFSMMVLPQLVPVGRRDRT